MIGIDIVQISRIKNPSLLVKKIFSNNELSLYNKSAKKKEFIAGRFAAKEAFLKANHKGIGDIALNKIEVLYLKDGAPYILYKKKKYDVSISHDGDYAIAMVNI